MGDVATHIREIRYDSSPVDTLERVRHKPFPFLLESSLLNSERGRFSFVGHSPIALFQSKGNAMHVVWPDGLIERRQGDPLDALKKFRARLEPHAASAPINFPLAGGLLIALSYDLSSQLHRMPSSVHEELGVPDIYAAAYDEVLCYDHWNSRCYLFTVERGEGPAGVPQTSQWDDESWEVGEIRSDFTPSEYEEIVLKAKNLIDDGEIYQVNLSQRFRAAFRGDPFLLYRRLRDLSPAPFSGFVDGPGFALISSSPERFLRKVGRQIETCPIKGTRPRGTTPEEDERLTRDLVSSDKDHAENVMIVDLERNDLGKVCDFGTVCVQELCALRSYARVHHLESVVRGRLASGFEFEEILKAAFPGGSITGAPKLRSMEIIDRLERCRRGFYTGSLGYVSYGGDFDLNILIRTIVATPREVWFNVGGGIVADSEPDLEYLETLHKAGALLSMLEERQLAREVVWA